MGIFRLNSTVALSVIAGISFCSSLQGETLNVAVASNFGRAMEAIRVAFESATAHEIRVIRGSSGKHYAQITNGAPFDVFLSADRRRPQLLLEEGIAVPGSHRTYALGQLALWSRAEGLVLGSEFLKNLENYQTLAIANPRLAPYGQAAVETLDYLGVAMAGQHKTVLGENIAQTFQFAFSGNADVGLVAYSQTLSPSVSNLGSVWLVPGKFHEPIRQDLVLLSDSEATWEFFAFMQSARVNEILVQQGYLLPEEGP